MEAEPKRTKLAGTTSLGIKLIGILNITPDSFSDGGLWTDPQMAISHARDMWSEGADYVDVGAESTRPGSLRISADEEWSRLAPVLPALLEAGIRVSLDTVHAETARKGIALGADIINDVSGGCFDPEMRAVVADSSASFVVQHWRGFPGSAGLDTNYDDVVSQVWDETSRQVDSALAAGVRTEQIIVDPGLGFALDADDSWTLVNDLSFWVATGYPVLVGASRKRFVRARFGDKTEEGTRLVTKQCREAGVWAVRVHDVAGNRQVLLD